MNGWRCKICALTCKKRWFSNRFCDFYKTRPIAISRVLRANSDRPTDRRTDGPTDGPTKWLIESRSTRLKIFKLKKALTVNIHFSSNLYCGQTTWHRPMKILHEKSELKSCLNLFSKSFYYFQKKNDIVFLYFIWCETPCSILFIT